MFYEPVKNNHGLSKNPFNSLVVPRPIGWISSIDTEGIVNLAPYSFFNAVCYKPPTVMFASGPGSGADGMKDSLRNIEDTGEMSDRQYRSGEPWAIQDFESIKNNPIDSGWTPRYVEVNFNNACNLKCSYCSPQFSTTWGKEIAV